MKILKTTFSAISIWIAMVGLFVTCSSAQTAAKPIKAPAAAKAHAKASSAKANAPAEPSGTGHSGEELWKAVSPTPAPLHLQEAELTPIQLGTVQQFLLDRAEADGWGCEDDSPADDWVKQLTYWQLPLTPTVRAIFAVTAGEGCGVSGVEGINRAMWVVIFNKDAVALLASPQESFNGFLYSVQPARTHGLPDLVVSWKVNETEQDLTYLRFDGMTYVGVLGAKRLESPNAVPHIVPTVTPKD